MNQSLQQQLAISVISLAKDDYSEQAFAKLDIGALQQTLIAVEECLPLEQLADATFLRHISDCLIAGQSVYETLMHLVVLSVSQRVMQGSNHPLERGIIKQKIQSLLPIFEVAFNQGLIRAEIYDKNADALVCMTENAADLEPLITALNQEYLRLKR